MTRPALSRDRTTGPDFWPLVRGLFWTSILVAWAWAVWGWL